MFHFGETKYPDISNEYSANAKKSLKIITYNIYGWRKKNQEDNFESLVDFFKKENPDVIGLQEVYLNSMGQLPKLAESLQMNYLFGPGFSSEFGNAILTKFKILDWYSIPLRMQGRETRNFICVIHENITVCCTHLDNADEHVRSTQFDQLVRITDKLGPHILMGDFNSLRRLDYSKTDWEYIFNERKQNKWELPTSELIDRIEKSYVDTWSFVGKFPIKSTCAFDTRIDYIFVSNVNKIKIEKSNRIEEEMTSDHYPVFVTVSIL